MVDWFYVSKLARQKKKDAKAKPDYWRPGDIITENDRQLLQAVLDRASELGYTPTKREVQGISRLKGRFRTWRNVIAAANLTWLDAPEQQQLRADARKVNLPAKQEPIQPQQ